MMENEELKKIKKKYGERFMHLCRELFPTILEQEGMLYEILSSTFSGNSKTLYSDIVDAKLEDGFKSYIYSKIDVEKDKMSIIEERTPYEILEEAGYKLTECETEEQIQGFKKYYAEDEELCTFKGGRLNRCVVFWAVKKDVEDIRRENFKNPSREDEYGTSVMGIQFNKNGRCTVSIKNRYNHKVNNPDTTYGNDLDRIAPGLTQSFARLLQKRGLELDSRNIETFSIPNYVVASDGKYYKYNMEVNGIYYCPGNIVIRQGTVEKIENSQMLIDYFLLDIKNKRIYTYDDSVEDGFTDALQDIERIEVRRSTKEDGTRVITILRKNQSEPIIIEIDENNQIIGYKNNELGQVGDNFLAKNRGLTQLEAPNLRQVGDEFLFCNEGLTQLEAPNLTQVGNNFLYNNEALTQLEAPNLTQVGNNFLYNNEGLTKLKLLSLREAKNNFLKINNKLTQLEAPNLMQVGHYFLFRNEGLTKLELQSLMKAEDDFLSCNKKLTQLEAPNLMQVGKSFLSGNSGLIRIKLPSLTQAESNFLYHNKGLTQLEAPSLMQVGNNFLHNNEGLTQLELPSLTQAGYEFLSSNKGLTRFDAPNLTQTGYYFLYRNESLTQLELPNLKQAGEAFLYHNKSLTRLEIPNCPEIREAFSHIIDENLQGNKKRFGAKDIAELDKSQELTTTEISFGRKIINRIVSLFKGINSER